MSAADKASPLLRLRDLSVAFPGDHQSLMAVDGMSLEIERGEIVGLVGESGSGKTMAARAIIGLLPSPAQVTGGSIAFKGRELTGLAGRAMRRIRGAEIGMIFQEPMVSLNPSLSIGRQMAEALALHRSDLSKAAVRKASIEMLERVRIAEAERCLACYPHEFSGGMRQRIMLASVMLLRPSLLLADEPTTALDVVIQKQVLDIMVEVTQSLGTSVLLITHDLGLVASYARRVTVMRSGRVVEAGSTEEILLKPQHAYTRALLAALPGVDGARSAASAAPNAEPLLSVEGLRISYPERRAWPWSPRRRKLAVAGVDLAIGRGETLAIVGESGSGKTTLGRSLINLVAADAGRLCFEGRELGALSNGAAAALRRQLQIVFQDPYSSLDPRMRLGEIVAEGLRHAPGLSRQQRRARALAVLEEVGLSAEQATRYPHELSGGQRQRVAIARAIVMRPKLIIADEPVSALDMTIQAQILELLKRLQREHGFSYLFITHDLGVVAEIADRVAVLYRGRVVEEGPAAAILERPRHPYTAALLQAVPALMPCGEGYRVVARAPACAEPPAGYRFAGVKEEDGAQQAPVMVTVGPGHRVGCLAG